VERVEREERRDEEALSERAREPQEGEEHEAGVRGVPQDVLERVPPGRRPRISTSSMCESHVERCQFEA
jgi:hypothetical protein